MRCKPYGNNIAPRRNHASILIGNDLIVYGGLSYKGKYFNDIWALNLKIQKWFKLKVTNIDE
jgi:hypothetical protein